MNDNLFKKFRLVPLNIQMFADGDGDGDADKDYKALYEQTLAERDKAKAEKDKASREASEFKKKLNEKYSDEEKKAQLDAEEKAKIEEIIKENKTLKLTTALSKNSVFTNEEVTELVNARYSDNDNDFAEKLISIVSKKMEDNKKSIYAEFKKNPHLPNGGSGDEKNEAIDRVKSIVNSKKSNKNFDSYFNN